MGITVGNLPTSMSIQACTVPVHVQLYCKLSRLSSFLGPLFGLPEIGEKRPRFPLHWPRKVPLVGRYYTGWVDIDWDWVGKIILLFLTKDTSNICKLTTAVSIAYHYVLFHEKLLLRMECSFVRWSWLAQSMVYRVWLGWLWLHIVGRDICTAIENSTDASPF